MKPEPSQPPYPVEPFERVADVYDERIRGRIDTFVSLIEPVVIIFMGLIVATMLLSVYLPIFNVIQVTG